MCQSRKFGVHHPKFLTWTPNLIKWKGERQLYKKNEKETRFNRRLSRKGCPKHRVVLIHQVYLYQRNQVKAWHCHNMSHKLTLSTLRSKKSQLLHPSKWKSNEKKKKEKIMWKWKPQSPDNSIHSYQFLSMSGPCMMPKGVVALLIHQIL